MVNRVIVGAHYGLGSWLVQRVSAVVMALYTLLFAGLLLASGPLSYASWKAMFAPGWMRFATFLFAASVLVHAWVGMRDIWMDYVKPTGLRLALEAATALLLIGCGAWALQILWRM
jgi:succinate dehydrogenase / fumarate reductase, membrane anchor subunit